MDIPKGETQADCIALDRESLQMLVRYLPSYTAVDANIGDVKSHRKETLTCTKLSSNKHSNCLFVFDPT